jgi:hydroxymethylglutaryl-CoA reductase
VTPYNQRVINGQNLCLQVSNKKRNMVIGCMGKSSLVSGFYKLSPKERLAFVKEFAGLSDEECALLRNTGSLPLDLADRMIENVIGATPVPMV